MEAHGGVKGYVGLSGVEGEGTTWTDCCALVLRQLKLPKRWDCVALVCT